MASIYKPSESGFFYTQVLNADGSPADGATVTLTVWKSDGTRFLNAVNMPHIVGSHGLYQYGFTAPATVQRMVANVWSTTPTAYGSDDIYVSDWTKDIDDTLDAAISSRAPEAGGNVAAIKAITDALPDAGALTTIQADLDNPDQYKADVAALALEATLTAMKGVGWTTETMKLIKDLIETI